MRAAFECRTEWSASRTVRTLKARYAPTRRTKSMRTATRSDALPTNGPSDTNTANAMTNSAPATTASARHAVLGAWIGPWSRAPGVEAALVYSLIVLFIWWIQL